MIHLNNLPDSPQMFALRNYFLCGQGYSKIIRSALAELRLKWRVSKDQDTVLPALLLIEKLREIESSARWNAFWSRPGVRFTAIVISACIGGLGVYVSLPVISSLLAKIIFFASVILLLGVLPSPFIHLIENVFRKDIMIGNIPFLSLPSHARAYKWQEQSARQCIHWIYAHPHIEQRVWFA